MRSIVQIGLVLVVIAGGVFVLTFLNQNVPSPIEKSANSGRTEATLPSGPPLKISQKRAEWDAVDPQYAAEFERGNRGHYDFWVGNANAEPVQIVLQNKSCVCTELDIGIVPMAELSAWRREAVALSVGLNLIGAPNIGAAIGDASFLRKIAWTPLIPRDKDPTARGATVPAAGPHGPQMAIVRLNWDGKEAKSQTLTADILHRLGEHSEAVRFEVPVMVVQPLMVSLPLVNVGELNYNDRREAIVVVWSATRDAFTLNVEDLSHDPCIEAGPPRLMSAEEKREATRQLRGAGLIPPTKMRVAYAVPVVVHERRGTAQLDLGPLNRRLRFSSDVMAEPSSLSLQGLVRGNVEVGEGADQDRVNLGAFRADRPHEKTVIVTAKQPNLQLRVKSKNPEFLEASLTESPGPAGLRQWKLKVEVDANKVSGVLPSDSAVFLETMADPPRAIRIPVIGNGTVR
jgi:hypothetical protein